MRIKKNTIQWICVAIIAIFFGYLNSVYASEPPFTDNFESYNIGQLTSPWSGTTYAEVVNDIVHTGAKSLKITVAYPVVEQDFSSSTDGITSFWIYPKLTSSFLFNMGPNTSSNALNLGVGFATAVCGSETCPFEYYDSSGWHNYQEITPDVWHSVQVKWWTESDHFFYSFNLDFQGWATAINMTDIYSGYTYFTTFKMRGGPELRIDDIAGEASVPAPTLTITVPTDASTITDPNELLYFSYTDFSSVFYPDAVSDFGIQVWFETSDVWHPSSDAYNYSVSAPECEDPLFCGGNGTFPPIPISTFNLFIIPGSAWHLHARPYYTDSGGSLVFDTELDLTYSLFFNAVSTANQTFCNQFENQSDCQNAYCTWSVGTSICNAVPAAPTPEDYNFTIPDFGFLGNMFRDVIQFLFSPSPYKITEQFTALQTALNQKIPFAYINAISILWTTGQGELTSEDYPKIEIDDPFATGDATLTILDFEETRTFVGSTSFDLMRTIMGYLFWLGAFYFIWETLHKSNSTKL